MQIAVAHHGPAQHLHYFCHVYVGWNLTQHFRLVRCTVSVHWYYNSTLALAFYNCTSTVHQFQCKLVELVIKIKD